MTCTSPPAKPMPRLSWFVNDEPAPTEYIEQAPNGRETRLIFLIQVQHLLEGKPRMRVTCEASFNYSHSSFGEKSRPASASQLILFLTFSPKIPSETQESKEIEIGANASFASSPVRITGLQASYAVGDEMRLTCSYRGQEDEVVMHWLLNEKRVQPRLVVRYKLHNYIGLKMRIGHKDLNHRNEVAVRCVATKFLFRVKRKSLSSSSSRLASGIRTLMTGVTVLLIGLLTL